MKQLNTMHVTVVIVVVVVGGDDDGGVSGGDGCVSSGDVSGGIM